MNKNNVSKKIINKAVQFSLRGSANSTTCFTIYQPKAPKSLRQFSKIENDK